MQVVYQSQKFAGGVKELDNLIASSLNLMFPLWMWNLEVFEYKKQNSGS